MRHRPNLCDILHEVDDVKGLFGIQNNWKIQPQMNTHFRNHRMRDKIESRYFSVSFGKVFGVLIGPKTVVPRDR